jgi:DNA-binding GntR family transcriptional regulator
VAESVMPVRSSPGNKRQQLPEEVAAYVREQIISGAVRPGDFLRMEPIAEAVGVSNTPVREGLLALRSEGFVRLVPRRGFVVAEFTQQDIRDLFWAQAQLAGELSARAAKRITPDRLARLDANVEAYGSAIAAGDRDLISDLGHEFHRIVNRAAESHRLALLLGSVVNHLPIRLYTTIDGQVAGAHAEHPRIVDLLRKGDSRKARSVMEKHILDGADRLIDALAQQGLWNGDNRGGS